MDILHEMQEDVFKDRPWAWKQGWLTFSRYPDSEYENPHKKQTKKNMLFELGYMEAEFFSKLDMGYFDE